jgi:sugar (pentulose or hexulose) kinase
MQESGPADPQPLRVPGAGVAPPGALLAVDVGGSGIRGVVLDPPDTVRHFVSRRGQSGRARFDPELTWLSVASIIRELTRRAPRISAVGLTAHLATVLINSDGRPTAPAMSWRDNSAWREAAELLAALGPDLESITGRPPTAEAAAARMRRLATSDPVGLSRVRWLLSLKDYLVYRLTGLPFTDPASASYTQLFDVRKGKWSRDIAEACGVAMAVLPSIRPAVAKAGWVTAAAARVTGLAPGTPVAVSGPDGSTGVLGTGAVQAGFTSDIAGTTDVLLHVTDVPPDRVGHGLALNAYLLDGLWALGGPTGLTGGGLEWLAATLGHESAQAAYRTLGGSLDVADPGNLMIRTTLTGRRLPSWDSEMRGRIDGISEGHGPAHLMRAAEEGGIFEVRLGLDALRAAGAEITTVVVAGGGGAAVRSLQLRANAWGLQVGTAHDGRASLRGAALSAAVAGGMFPDVPSAVAAMVPPLRFYEPDPVAAIVSEQRYQRWRELMYLSPEGKLPNRQENSPVIVGATTEES